jgi:hypothetical protein
MPLKLVTSTLLALDQREAAEIFGGGIIAFSRYENGKPNRLLPW